MGFLLCSKLTGDVLISSLDGTYVFRSEADVISEIQNGVEGADPVVFAREENVASVAGALGIKTVGKEVTITREGNVGRITSYARTVRVPIDYPGRPPFVER